MTSINSNKLNFLPSPSSFDLNLIKTIRKRQALPSQEMERDPLKCLTKKYKNCRLISAIISNIVTPLFSNKL